MKPLLIIAVVLVILGIGAIAIPSFTYFTTERVAETRFFVFDVQKPHTIIPNPAVGVASLAAGIALVVIGRPAAR